MINISSLPAPTPWPNLNSQLLEYSSTGLPIDPLDRLSLFSADEFERFTLQWAHDYLLKKENGYQVQQRGGSGDKGRDVLLWLDPPDAENRRLKIFQCKHYTNKLNAGNASEEIAKVIYYTYRGEYTFPIEYWFITHLGATSPLQDLIDNPDNLKNYILNNWEDKYSKNIIKNHAINLTNELNNYIEELPFEVFRIKQPHELIEEHSMTKYHLQIFGGPLIERPLPPMPSANIAPMENGYVSQMYQVISEATNRKVSSSSDFEHNPRMKKLFDKSRITFYCAEGLKQLSRDQMTTIEHFETLMNEFEDGLFHTYTKIHTNGLSKLQETVSLAQTIQLGPYPLANLTNANDREGICHHLANENRITWCETYD